MVPCKHCSREFKEGPAIRAHERQCSHRPPPDIEGDESSLTKEAVAVDPQPPIGGEVRVFSTSQVNEGTHPAAKFYTSPHGKAQPCPQCNQAFRPYRKIGEELLCCLACGVVFGSRNILSEWREEVGGITWSRPDPRQL